MRRPWYRRYLPGWFVTGAGGSGGAATVQTDGVTLQGDGSSGNKIRILQVETQARITGAGTVASPLDITGWPLNFYQTEVADSSQDIAVGQNNTLLAALIIPYALTFSVLGLNPHVGDGGANTSFGLYNNAGTRIAHTAPAALGTGIVTFNWIEGSQTINAGVYWFACSTSAATVTLYTCESLYAPYANGTFVGSSGGNVPASITPPAYNVLRFSLPSLYLR